MIETPKVSIIIPIYNSEKWLKRCLNSVVKQTLKNIEILCVEDKSTDNSRKILYRFARKDKRIRLILFGKNHGVAFARNKALLQARGEFIGFVDSDDWVDPDYFNNLYKQSENYDIVRGIRLVDEEHRRNEYGCLVPSIIRNSLIINHNLSFPSKTKGEDSTFKYLLYQHTDKILETADVGCYYHYCRRAGSLSNYNL